MSRSAGINFGVPNSEYRLRIDPVTGEALSCYNQDTDTEYIGGGGGDSDFSTAQVTIISGVEFEATIPLIIAAEADELGEGSPACVSYCIYLILAGSNVYKTPLYKGGCIIDFDLTNTSLVKSYSGSIAPLGSHALITGDCTIELNTD